MWQIMLRERSKSKMGRQLEPISNSISAEEIDKLLAYLPLLADLTAHFAPEWTSPEDSTAGEITMRYPKYPDSVREFFDAAAKECWSDYGYDPFVLGETIQDDTAIASSSLEQLRALLTYCVRGERFCDGHWIALIREGRVLAILQRLKQLRATV